MKKLLTFFLSLTIILLILNVFLKEEVVNKYSQEYIRNVVTDSLINSLEDNFEKKYIDEIESKLRNSRDFQVICDKLYDQIILDLNNNEISNIDIREDIINIIDTNYKDINKGYRNYIVSTINNMDFNRLYRNILGYIREKLPKDSIKYINILYEFLSIKVRVILIISLILENILIVLLTKDKKDLIFMYGINMTISGGVLLFIGLILGNLLSQINSFILVISIVLLFLGMILKEIYERKVL